MPREIANGIHWIEEAYLTPELKRELSESTPIWYDLGADVQVCDNAYLIEGDRTLLFDTLSPAGSEQIVSELDHLLDGRDLDYVLPSHPENPHAGSTFAILEAHPEAELLAPAYDTEKHELYYFDDATHVSPGETINLGGRVLEVVEPKFLDHRIHVWLFDRATGTLFTVDWLGDVHMSKNHLDFVDEVADDDPVARQVEFHSRALFWFQYIQQDKAREVIEEIIETHDPYVLAPAHGLVVRETTAEYMRMNNAVIDRIIEQGRKMSAY
jgi:flavorubredoxin